MSVSPKPASNIVPVHQGLAYIIGAVTILFPSIACWQYGGATVLGQSPLLKLLSISAIGGAASFACFAERGYRLMAIVPGVIGGLGGSFTLVLYTTEFAGRNLWKLEIVLALGLGMLPGILLFFVLARCYRKRTR